MPDISRLFKRKHNKFVFVRQGRPLCGRFCPADAAPCVGGTPGHPHFALNLLAVARVIPYGVILGVTVIALLLVARAIFRRVDYSLLLSEFTEDLPALIIGVNLGGLGTLIASMASLISYKLIAREENHAKAVLPYCCAKLGKLCKAASGSSYKMTMNEKLMINKGGKRG